MPQPLKAWGLEGGRWLSGGITDYARPWLVPCFSGGRSNILVCELQTCVGVGYIEDIEGTTISGSSSRSLGTYGVAKWCLSELGPHRDHGMSLLATATHPTTGKPAASSKLRLVPGIFMNSLLHSMYRIANCWNCYFSKISAGKASRWPVICAGEAVVGRAKRAGLSPRTIDIEHAIQQITRTAIRSIGRCRP